MKITGTSSCIKVQINDRTVKIEGEMMVGGFLAYSNTIEKWEPPHDCVFIEAKDKSELIEAIINKTKESSFKIDFD
jgi:hypothetical protein